MIVPKPMVSFLLSIIIIILVLVYVSVIFSHVITFICCRAASADFLLVVRRSSVCIHPFLDSRLLSYPSSLISRLSSLISHALSSHLISHPTEATTFSSALGTGGAMKG